MSNKKILKNYDTQITKAQYCFHKYIDDLKLHFEIEDNHILKILQNEIKIIKSKNTAKIWFNFLKK